MRALVATRVAAAMAALSLIVAGIVAVGAPAYAATPIQVTSANDSWAGDCDSAAPASPVTLRNAICVANVRGGAQSVSVPPGTYSLDSALGPLVVGTHSGSHITVEAAGAEVVIESGGAHRLMTLDPKMVGNVTVQLRGLQLRGGVDNTYGGGAIIGGSYYAASPDTLIIENSRFLQNQANTEGSLDPDSSNRPGGAIQFIGGNLTVAGSVFAGNSSGSSPGGAIAYQATHQSHSLSIAGSTFTENSTRAVGVLPNGGAAVAIDDQSSLAAFSITGSSFVSNVSTGTAAADARGAAVWLRGGTLNLHQSTIIGNNLAGGTASAGAAVHVEGDASLTANHNRLFGNTGGAALHASASVNAANNWWGCATGPGTAGCDTVHTKSSADRTPWLTLRATANPVDIPLDEETTTVTASLLTNSAGDSVPVGKLTAFEGLPIAWTKPLPSDSAVAAHSPTLSNGTATATYTKNSAKGAGSVTATVDNAAARATLGILYPPRFTSADTAQLTVDDSESFTVTTDAYHPATISFTGFLPDGSLPDGVAFQAKPNGTAVFGGVPADGTGGVYTGELSATNSVGPDATQPFTLTILESPEFVGADEAKLTHGTAGSFTIETDGYPVAAISPRVFHEQLNFVDNGDGTATVSMAADADLPEGFNWLYFEADNGVGWPILGAFTLEVHRAPTVTLQPLPVTVNSSTTATFTAEAAVGYPAPNVRWQVSTDDGRSYTEIPGATQPTLAFTAGQGDDGNLYRAVFANSPGMMASLPALLTVGTPPVFESAAGTTFTAEGGTQAFTVTTSAVPPATITGAGLPSWLTLDAAGPGVATLTGSPPRGSGGAYPIVLTAGNTFDPDATQAFTLTVHEAPLLAATNAAAFTTGILGNFPMAASPTGFPLPTALTLTGTLPAGLAFTSDDDGTASITGAPDPGIGGTYTVTVTAENTVGSSEQTLTITVAEPPIVTGQPAPQRVVAGEPASFSASADGYPAPTIQWKVSTDGGTTFSDLPGETAANLTLSTVQGMNGHRYRAVFTSTSGTASTDAALLVVGTPASITSGAASTFVADAGEQRFAMTAIGAPFPTFVLGPTAPSWLSLEDDGTGTPTLVGTPPTGSGGSHAFTVTADNGFGSSDVQNFTLNVVESARFLSTDAATFTVGISGRFSVSTAPGTPAATTLSLTGTLPTGVSFNSTGGTATITGEPAEGTGAVYPLLLTASNGSAPDTTQAFTLTVAEAPVVTMQPAAATVNAGSSATFIATAAGFPAPTVTWEVSTDGGTTFTPIAGETASTVTIAASQSDNGNRYRAVFTNGTRPDAVTDAAVLRVGTAPTFSNLATTTFTVGRGQQSFAITTSGVPDAVLGLGSGAPSWLSFTDHADGTGSMFAEPAVGDGGLYAFDLIAGNGFTPDAAQPFALIVNEAPLLDATGAATFSTDAVGSTTITATVGYPTATTFTVTGTLPGGVSFTDNLDGTATISGRPSGAGGTFPLAVTASNGAGTDATQAFTLTVTDATVVTAHPVDVTVASGTATTFTSSASGFPPPAVQWQVSTDGGASFTDVAGATATTLTFTAAQHQNGHLFRAAFSGTGVATSDPALLTVGTPAQIISAAQVTFASGAGTQTATLSASGIPVGLISLSGGPSWLTLVDHADGTATLSATPPVGSGADYPVTISASNGFGAVATQLLTVVVSQTGGIDSSVATTFTVGIPGSFLVTMGGGHPAVGSLNVTGSLPAGVGFTDNGDGTATIAGTPGPGTGGQHQFDVVASYGLSPVATQRLTLTVQEAPTVTSASAAEFVHGVQGSFTITAGGYPSDATISLSGTLPAGLSFVDNGDGTATIAGITTEPVGSTAVTVDATNIAGSGSTQTLTITVVPAAVVPLPLVIPTSDGPLTGISGQVAPGQTVTVSGDGFAVNAPVTVGIYSVPTHLAQVLADSAGRFTATITVPVGFTGSHAIVATGFAPSGDVRTLTFGVSVVSAAGLPIGEVALPFTGGGDATSGAVGSLLLLLVGAALIAVARIRRRHQHRVIPLVELGEVGS